MLSVACNEYVLPGWARNLIEILPSLVLVISVSSVSPGVPPGRILDRQLFGSLADSAIDIRSIENPDPFVSSGQGLSLLYAIVERTCPFGSYRFISSPLFESAPPKVPRISTLGCFLEYYD